jgi:cation transport regulator ChaC
MSVLTFSIAKRNTRKKPGRVEGLPAARIRMRDKWYGDNRDLVKWGVLLELAQRYQAQQILQVLYKRPSTWERLEIDGEQVELPATVIHHFRDATSVSAMQCPARVEVVSETFDDRSD